MAEGFERYSGTNIERVEIWRECDENKLEYRVCATFKSNTVTLSSRNAKLFNNFNYYSRW